MKKILSVLATATVLALPLLALPANAQTGTAPSPAPAVAPSVAPSNTAKPVKKHTRKHKAKRRHIKHK